MAATLEAADNLDIRATWTVAQLKDELSITDTHDMRDLRFNNVLRAFRRRIVREERGWVLMDAVWSTVVVIGAFVATTMAFDGATRSVARDSKKSQAMQVAQNEINRMRAVGQRSINDLTSMNNTTQTVAFEGVNYNVAYKAYYVTGMGGDEAQACELTFGSSSGASARFIYTKVNVTYAGQVTGSTSATSDYATEPTSLSNYFAPEGGGSQPDTGTLRVYVLDHTDAVASGISTVQLYIAGESTALRTQTINPTTGCVLFTGLTRNTYQVRVPVTGRQDLYMSNTGTAVNLTVVMPDRGSLTRDIRLANPVTVNPIFRVRTGTGATPTIDVNSSTSGVSPFVGHWTAESDSYKSAPDVDHARLPGRVYMPRTVPTSTLRDKLFPLKAGYSAYAGSCDWNDPNSGVNDGVTNNQVLIPTTIPHASWVPNGTYTPVLPMSQIRTAPTLVPIITSQPSSGLQSGATYYWDQRSLGFKVKVKLVSDAASEDPEASCKPSAAFADTWVQLPGTITTSGLTLADVAEILPVGKYEVCVRATFTATQRTRNTSTFSPNWANSATNANHTRYIGYTGSDAVAIPYNGYVNRSPDFSPGNTQEPGTGDATDCSDTSWT